MSTSPTNGGLENCSLAYFIESNKRRDYSKSTHAQLVKDVNRCFDFLKRLLKEKEQLKDSVRALVKEKDELIEKYHKAQRRLDLLNLKFWAVSAVVLALCAVNGWLASQLFARIH